MGFGNTFVDVLRRLVGISKDPPVAVIDPNAVAAAGESAPEPVADPDDDDDLGADDDSLPPMNARDEWEDMQAFVARCEAEAIELCGIDIDDPTSFWEHYSRIETNPDEPSASAEDPDAAREARAKAAGFADLHHWEWVSQYCQIKWSELVEDTDPPEIRAKPSFSAAAERARVRP